jgi:hypothetical protein
MAMTLQRELNRMFGMGRRPRQPDPDAASRRRFKALAKREGFTFAKTRDGYVEATACPALPDGLTTAYHGWAETLARFEACIADPALIVKGYFSE